MIAWFLANLLTSISYFVIAAVMWSWTGRVQQRGFTWLIVLFVAFITTCATHHVLMLIVHPGHGLPIWKVIIDMAMASSSVLAALVLSAMRKDIGDFIVLAFKADEKLDGL